MFECYTMGTDGNFNEMVHTLVTLYSFSFSRRVLWAKSGRVCVCVCVCVCGGYFTPFHKLLMTRQLHDGEHQGV